MLKTLVNFSRAGTIKTFTTANNFVLKEASVFVTVSHIHPIPMFEVQAGANASGAPYVTLL